VPDRHGKRGFYHVQDWNAMASERVFPWTARAPAMSCRPSGWARAACDPHRVARVRAIRPRPRPAGAPATRSGPRRRTGAGASPEHWPSSPKPPVRSGPDRLPVLPPPPRPARVSHQSARPAHKRSRRPRMLSSISSLAASCSMPGKRSRCLQRFSMQLCGVERGTARRSAKAVDGMPVAHSRQRRAAPYSFLSRSDFNPRRCSAKNNRIKFKTIISKSEIINGSTGGNVHSAGSR
jgi:hypothetical protein